MMPLGLTDSVWLAVGGALGVAIRAFLTNGQRTLSRETIQDILLGGALGFLWTVRTPDLPLIGIGWPPFEFPESARLAHKVVIVAGFSWLFAEAVKSLLVRFRPAWLDRYSGNGKEEPKGPPPSEPAGTPPAKP